MFIRPSVREIETLEKLKICIIENGRNCEALQRKQTE